MTVDGSTALIVPPYDTGSTRCNLIGCLVHEGIILTFVVLSARFALVRYDVLPGGGGRGINLIGFGRCNNLSCVLWSVLTASF